MKIILIIPFILFFVATASSLANANEAKNAQDRELSKHRHADQEIRKQAHSHDRKQKSRYDLRDLDGKQKRDGHKHGHEHGHKDGHKDGHKHDHKAVSKTDLHGKGSHDHGDSHKHDHGDAHQSHGDGHGSHDDQGHQGHGEGHGGHDHGYDRLWGIGISG